MVEHELCRRKVHRGLAEGLWGGLIERFDNLVGRFFGVAAGHRRIVAAEQFVIHPGVARGE